VADNRTRPDKEKILTTQQPTQQEILDFLQEDLARFHKLINRLNEEQQQVAITPQGWSVKDFLAHMSHWKAATQKLLVAYTHDQPLPPVMPSGDEADEEARQMDKSLSLPQVRNYWEETHEHFTHLVADNLDDKTLREEVRPPWDGNTDEPICAIVASICKHDAEHFALIEQYFEVAE
jgi:hypothetical protein